ncbi:transposase domain-containing protein [Streptomyces sp. NPDC057705]|uniref:transposase domain-containing protein n=1 Tax=Streptomyces sp. NPDC057705 TaxID=3346222 RepID=UPI0036B1AC98
MPARRLLSRGRQRRTGAYGPGRRQRCVSFRGKSRRTWRLVHAITVRVVLVSWVSASAVIASVVRVVGVSVSGGSVSGWSCTSFWLCAASRESYGEVLRVLTSGIPGSRTVARVNRSSLCRARARLGEDVLESVPRGGWPARHCGYARSVVEGAAAPGPGRHPVRSPGFDGQR